MNYFIFGDYPDIMKKKVGSMLPSFTQKESNLVGLNSFLGNKILLLTCQEQS